MKKLLGLLLIVGATCYGVGTVTVTRSAFMNVQSTWKHGEKVTVSWVSTAGGLASDSIELRGFLMKVITNPSATAPTDNYDLQLFDPADAALDALGALLMNRDTATTEQYPTAGSTQATMCYLNGTYTFDITNAGASKEGVAIFYLLNP